jgi:hypothetical protein
MALNEDRPETMQIFLTHEDTIDAAFRWAESMGWELKRMPDFSESDDPEEIPTYMIVPQNLDRLMAERAAAYRKEHGLD